MSESWFIEPGATVDLPLPEFPGHWIRVKSELSFGEENALMSAMMGQFNATGTRGKNGGKAEVIDASMPVDMKKFQVERFFAWVVGWSAVIKKDVDLVPVPITRDTIANLRGPYAAAIDAALDRHVSGLEEEKKAPNGVAASAPSST